MVQDDRIRDKTRNVESLHQRFQSTRGHRRQGSLTPGAVLIAEGWRAVYL